jgi:sugar fermentation stimulation protein A
MKFAEPLIPGRLVRRYKRFLSDIESEGQLVTAHCPNPGSMMGLLDPGSQVWLSRSRNPSRKLPYTWELVRAKGALVGINTGHANRVVAEALAAGRIPELAGYERVRREVRYGQASRIDLLLEGPKRPKCYVEVKNVTLKRAGHGAAEFPDAVTVRGAKHLRELSHVAAAGERAVIFYLVQRQDCDRFSIAADIDPAYAAGFERALALGVEALCYACKVSPEAIELDRPLPLALEQAAKEART